ncbi:ABC transporter ATP-binding protein [Natrialba sp. INN-245]|uniref:ABC transporter ATP-binding protein n=1 Tax=Natrialba sp. INN-245 TaxID=2690967 RepID=UPI0013133DF7|nr:ABC transporter ATP-binding protein [Natrialba sp. INN-245]MWV38844.1 ATP-binding cassette domain-containing protein [Natrialba sp. INN-245]
MGELTLDGVAKRFDAPEEDGAVVAVDDLNIEVRDGEFLVLVGPSGCGKSTTLRCISGLEVPTDGNILLNGTDITNEKPSDRDMAMVFQNYALYPHMTAHENIAFGLRMSTDFSDEKTDRIVEETAEMMGIADQLEDRPAELSGGQQQRVALGRAIVREPEVFLMDEPLSNLDAKLRTTMRTELQSLQQELGTTTIYVTHDQTEAMTMADRIAILNNGVLQQIGTPLECYHRPNNQFVAGFIGTPSMNFIPVTHEDGVLQHDLFEYNLSNDVSLELLTEVDSLVMGIRPEDVQIASGSERNTVQLTIEVTEPMGDQTHLYLELGNEELTATVDGLKTVQSGETIQLALPEERIHLFDRTTGEALKNSDIVDEAKLELGAFASGA